MDKNRFLLLFMLLLLTQTLVGQDMARVRKRIDTLCSPTFRGRGYVAQGDKKAAVYLSEELKKIGALPLGSTYFQHFGLDVNTFPDKMALSLDNKPLTAGKDFIISPIASGGKANAKCLALDTLLFSANEQKRKQATANFLKHNLKNTALWFAEKYEKRISEELNQETIQKIYGAKALLILRRKLTMSVANQQLTNPEFWILEDKFPIQTKKIHFEVDAQVIKNYQSQNVLAYVKGTKKSDKFIVFTAHYDHLGGLGNNVFFPGANDNASGTALLLELAHYYAANPPPFSVAFMFFGAEEVGLVGSKFYTDNPIFPLQNIDFLINLDLSGTGDEGITVVNGAIHQQEFDLLQTLNTENKWLPNIQKRGTATNSDHYFFSQRGVKAFFIYARGGIKAYHDVFDRPETLPLTEFEDLFRLITAFANRLMP